ncbi:MAG TPA: nucleoside triphosphate pyrophosphohydrolase family protein [Alphaproteobacteria bacterium]|nr:nucleoside triphosphate pyrophosphohydrolase family protein [Alphaproteobacteria bacterium]
MELDDYATWAARVAEATPMTARERLAYLALGLSGEAGEVADHVKKTLRDGDAAWNPAKVAEELGDVIFGWAALCAMLGRKPSDILEASRAKIEARIANGRHSAG